MFYRFDNPESLSRAAADLFIYLAREAVSKRGRFNVALSGGRTPQRTYQILAQPAWRDQTPWPHIHVFWGDERCVAAEDERSNSRMAYQTLLNHVSVVSDHVHPITCDKDPQTAASKYNEVLRTSHPPPDPVFDLVLLGLGQNGHTASLFPYSPALDEKKCWAIEVYIPEQKMHRITLTPMIINASRVIAFLLFGRDKAQILKEVLEGPQDGRRLPAQLIQPRTGQLIWMVDQAAASMLKDSTIRHLSEETFDTKGASGDYF
jgi:6-phosphogluconolactonase